MQFDWKSLVGTVAPTIATALGGPLAGMAVRALAGAVGLTDEASEKDIAAAMKTASPETLAAIRKADQDFAIEMERLGIDLERIAAEDRKSARERESTTGDSVTPRLLALFITAGFFGILSYMMVNGAPVSNNDAMLVMLGSLGTAFAGVIAYYFGSSAGSKSKDAALAGAIKRG